MANVAYRAHQFRFELFELLPDAILVVDRQGIIRYANRQAGRLFGQEPATLVSAPVEALVPEHLRERHVDHRRKFASEPRMRPMGAGLDLAGRRADGTTFPVDIMLNPIKHLDEPMVLAVVRDVTDRRAAEEAVRKSRMTFETLYERSPDAIILVDERGKIDRVNAAAETSFGLPRERLRGQPIESLIPERFHGHHLAHRAAYMEDSKTRPMGTGLQLSAQRADGSEFPVDIMLSPIEIEQRRMVLAVVRDVTGRRNSEEARARLAAIVTSSEDAIIGMTLDGVITSWNEAAERMFGYSAGEMMGQPIRRLIPADRQAEEDLIPGHVARGEPVGHYETVRNAKGGRTIDVSVTMSPMRDTKGRIIGASKIVRDIRARKQAEETLRLLMREANHRVKNLLSLVQAIARQTATGSTEDFVGRFTERIQALAADQDLLVRNAWRGVDVGDLVRAQLAHFADLVGSRIAMLGPELRLNSAAAQAIGLALHELATNAGKYGSLSTNTGRVDVCWGTDGDTLTMNWTERDGPPVSPPQRRGFGTTVMKTMAERSVDGAVDLDYAPLGVTWRLTCPAANALEPGERESIPKEIEPTRRKGA